MAGLHNLQSVTDVKLRRWMSWTPSCRVQLHAFADASRRAFAAVVYDAGIGAAQVTLVMANTKLAPIRSLARNQDPPARMTIPRLELRATLLAARLLRYTSDILRIPPTDCHAWSDSRIVLHWLSSDRSLNNNFADDYVSQVHEIVPDCRWHHTPTTQNPADLGTRASDVCSIETATDLRCGDRSI